MGGCASKSEVLKNVEDAPLPAPEKEETDKEVIEEVNKVDEAPVDADEAKRQSLGHLFKEVNSYIRVCVYFVCVQILRTKLHRLK